MHVWEDPQEVDKLSVMHILGYSGLGGTQLICCLLLYHRTSYHRQALLFPLNKALLDEERGSWGHSEKTAWVRG